MIGVLDLKAGNLRSVCNAVYECGFDYQVVSSVGQFDDLSHIIIPGVGHFGRVVRHVVENSLFDPLREFAASGRPLLGLCVGMQLLATSGSEGGEIAGLNLVPGTVVRFNIDKNLAVPHVGWNDVVLKRDHPVFVGIRTGRDFYFVHSYHLVCDQPDYAIGVTDYGASFVSAVGRDNIVGFQFHPEKSQLNGLSLIENFCRWDGKC